jgi:hypothetical protein
VKRYHVQYTLDGQTWYTWRESNSPQPRTFGSLVFAWTAIVRNASAIALPVPANHLAGVRIVSRPDV